MSKLEELIQELCPDGVEYKKIKEVYKRIKGTPITAAKMKEIADDNGDVKIFAGGKTIVYAFEKDIPNANITRIPAVLVQSRGVIDVVYYDLPFTFKNEMWAYTHENPITLKFLYYVLKNNINKFRDEAAGMGSMPQISLKVTEDFNMPVPPLEVQQEIVHLLDDFTAKTAELQAELNKEYEARKKQYEYDKEVLLCNNENVDKVKIKDIVCKTNKIKWNQTENTYQYIDLSSVDRETHTLLNTSIIDRNNAPSRAQQIVCVDDVLFGTTRPMLKRLCVIPDEYDGQICSTGFCVLRAIDNIVQPKWIYHVLNTTQFYSYVESHQQGTSYPSISDSLVKEYEITLPSLDEQIRIINILDNLEETNFELNNNLSLELESRQKQYEFYRDKLLTFKELS